MTTHGHDTTDNNNSKATGYETTDVMKKKKVDNVKILGMFGGIGSGKSTVQIIRLYGIN